MFEDWGAFGEIFLKIAGIVIAYIVLNLILNLITKKLRKSVHSKHMHSNVEIFSNVFHYLIILILALYVIFSYSGSLTGFGLSLGLMSAALGWALQRPITGVAGWIMVILKRPFINRQNL